MPPDPTRLLSDQAKDLTKVLEAAQYDLASIAKALAKNDHPAPCGVDACIYCWAECTAAAAAGDIAEVLARGKELA